MKAMMVLTDHGEVNLGVAGGGLSEVDTAPVRPRVTLVHVVQRQRCRVCDSEEVPALVKDLLVLPMRRCIRVLPPNVITVGKRQC